MRWLFFCLPSVSRALGTLFLLISHPPPPDIPAQNEKRFLIYIFKQRGSYPTLHSLCPMVNKVFFSQNRKREGGDGEGDADSPPTHPIIASRPPFLLLLLTHSSLIKVKFELLLLETKVRTRMNPLPRRKIPYYSILSPPAFSRFQIYLIFDINLFLLFLLRRGGAPRCR